ncbi:uncharacterized protein LOC134257003 [Saccostrea cucullata]|uniref:uncharacterized protein LOC134257003 n=1 Tax=Saccostrea cuccullata TaxID=36930 RepID=UPI002ED6911B
MPKAYKQRKREPYSSESMQNAVSSVMKGTYSIRKAAEMFNVNKSTFHDTIKKKYKNPGQPGRKTAIPPEVEQKIANALKEASKQGMGISRRQLLRRVGSLCKKMKIEVDQFKQQTPGKDWFVGFMKRHPTLSIRKPEKLATTRARMTNPAIVSKYFDDLGQILKNLGLLSKPACIWNCDETGKSFEHTPVKVIAEKGSKAVVGRTSSCRTNITVMACVNAAGGKMSPLFIVKGKTSRSLHGFNTLAAPQGTRWHYQANGWMNDDIGEKWFEDVFLMECGTERPQLLILDGHSSHESLSIIELAIQNDIHILSLPPHTTHALQPLDRCVFGPLNSAYNTECSNFLNQNPLNNINKWSFPGILAVAWETAVSKTNIQAGFQSCGIFPFNPSAVAPELLKPSIPSDKPKPLLSSADEISSTTTLSKHSEVSSGPPSVSGPSVSSSSGPVSFTIVSSGVGSSLLPTVTPSTRQDLSINEAP